MQRPPTVSTHSWIGVDRMEEGHEGSEHPLDEGGLRGLSHHILHIFGMLGGTGAPGKCAEAGAHSGERRTIRKKSRAGGHR